MEVKEILKKVKRIELKARKNMNTTFLGSYHSNFKGRGMIFNESRPYFFGDDVRAMDWNKTAHFNEPYVKVFEEERELSLILMLDVSRSSLFSSTDESKKQIMIEVAATIALSAIGNNDKVGLILFSDKVEFFVPPAKGRKHVLRIIREMIECEPEGKKTDLNTAFQFLMRLKKHKQIVFLLSDFITDNYEKLLASASRKHILTAIKVIDDKEESFPDLGLIRLKDMETGEVKFVNTARKSERRRYTDFFAKQDSNFRQAMKRAGVPFIDLKVKDDYNRALIKFLQSNK